MALIEAPGYTLRIWVTNRPESPLELWRDYNGRSTIELRIRELKNDLGADDFCTQNLWATEAAFLAVLFTFTPQFIPATERASRPLLPAGYPARSRLRLWSHPGTGWTSARVASVGLLGRNGQAQSAAGHCFILEESNVAEAGPARRFARQCPLPDLTI